MKTFTQIAVGLRSKEEVHRNSTDGFHSTGTTGLTICRTCTSSGFESSRALLGGRQARRIGWSYPG